MREWWLYTSAKTTLLRYKLRRKKLFLMFHQSTLNNTDNCLIIKLIIGDYSRWAVFNQKLVTSNTGYWKINFKYYQIKFHLLCQLIYFNWNIWGYSTVISTDTGKTSLKENFLTVHLFHEHNLLYFIVKKHLKNNRFTDSESFERIRYIILFLFWF